MKKPCILCVLAVLLKGKRVSGQRYPLDLLKTDEVLRIMGGETSWGAILISRILINRIQCFAHFASRDRIKFVFPAYEPCTGCIVVVAS